MQSKAERGQGGPVSGQARPRCLGRKLGRSIRLTDS